MAANGGSGSSHNIPHHDEPEHHQRVREWVLVAQYLSHSFAALAYYKPLPPRPGTAFMCSSGNSYDSTRTIIIGLHEHVHQH